MLLHSLLFSLSLASYVSAVHLFVASYSGGDWAGNISTLSLDQKTDATYHLSLISSVNSSTNSPSWLTYNRQNKILYLIDEAVNLTTNGTIVAYRTSYSGQLTEISRTEALIGGVSSTFYADGGALAVAHYTGSTLQTYNVGYDGGLKLLQTFNFSTPEFRVGPIADRQEAPHPHEALLDPTGQFILVPDLGFDQVHIFRIDPASKELVPQAPLKTTPGYGPRHAVFSPDKIGGAYYMFYLNGELSDRVTAYKVEYGGYPASLKFSNVSAYDTLNPRQSFPANPDGSTKVAPAEIAITPDGSTLIVSNRNDTTFGTSPPTDSLVSYAISPSDGTLKKESLVSTHGSFPRHFALNSAGTLLAVGLQNSGAVVILQKNQKNGLFDKEVANLNLTVGADIPVCIVWDE